MVFSSFELLFEKIFALPPIWFGMYDGLFIKYWEPIGRDVGHEGGSGVFEPIEIPEKPFLLIEADGALEGDSWVFNLVESVDSDLYLGFTNK